MRAKGQPTQPVVDRHPSHFEQLAQLVELERAEQVTRYRESLAELSLGERQARGHLALNLEVVDESVGLGGRFLLTLEPSDKRPLLVALHPGDLVQLWPRRSADPPRESGVLAAADRHRVQVALERPPPPFLSGGRLVLEVLPNDVTFERMRSALSRIQTLSASRDHRRREVLLGNQPPLFERVAALSLSRPLNAEQADAAAKALAAQDFFLVHGPPGTGKSTVLAELAVQGVRRGERILATAASNAAVDHLLELCLDSGLEAVRVGHPARVAPAVLAHSLDVLVENHPDRRAARDLFDEAYALQGYARKQRHQGRSRERFAHARASSAQARALLREARALETKAVKAVLDRAQVLCATLAHLEAPPLSGATFDWALVDEATQATEPLTLLAFLRAQRVVLAGDHRQLPPTVLSRKAAESGLSLSLFERLLSIHGEGAAKMLAEQYRMSEALMTFPSKQMYRGALRAHPSVASRALAEVLAPGAKVDAPPLLWLDTAGKGFEDARDPQSDSHYNEGEAQLVAARARELLAAGLDPRELAVIAPYRAQVDRIREKVPTPEVEVDTVDAFQGREKDAVLVSFTRSNADRKLGFLEDLRRTNVALTRAKRHLFLVADSATLAAHPFYAELLDWTQRSAGYRSAWEWPAAGGSDTQS